MLDGAQTATPKSRRSSNDASGMDYQMLLTTKCIRTKKVVVLLVEKFQKCRSEVN